MTSMVPLVFMLSQAAPVAHAQEGYLGVRYQEQAEGLVVTEVVPGMGAAAAGMVAGDLIVTVADHTVGPNDEFPPLRGDVGSSIELGVVAPLGGGVRTVVVERTERLVEERVRQTTGKNYRRFSGSLRRGSARDAREAALALVDADYDGMDPLVAFSALPRASKRSPRKARMVLKALTASAVENPKLNRVVGVTYGSLAQPDKAALYLAAARASDADDLGARLGRDAWADRDLAMALWDAGERADSIELTRSIAPALKSESLWKKTGMATPTPTAEWSLTAEPLDEVEMELGDGSVWRLSEQAGRPVAMVFWASWCAPCKKEMPELASLVRSRPDWPVSIVAVSVDKDAHREQAEAMLKRWDLPFPSAFTRSLGERMDVVGLPSLRVIGPDGTLRSASSGYSKKSVAQLEKTLDRLVKSDDSGAAKQYKRPFAGGWSVGEVKLRGVVPVFGVRDLIVEDGRIAGIVGDHGALEMPVVDGTFTGDFELEEGLTSVGDKHVAWFDGAVSAGQRWIRSRDENGATRWFRTMSDVITDVTASGDQLWVSTETSMTVFDPLGAVIQTIDRGAVDMASATDGGVWAVDGQTRIRFSADGSVALSDEAPRSKLIASDGGWVGKGFVQLAVGRFGPDGEVRAIAQRSDGTIVGLSQDGAIALRIDVHNQRGHSFAVGDTDGDGKDELLLSSFGHGVATLELEIP